MKKNNASNLSRQALEMQRIAAEIEHTQADAARIREQIRIARLDLRLRLITAVSASLTALAVLVQALR